MSCRKKEWGASDYRKAACKHMNACSELINMINSPKLNQRGHREIYHEIYYLSGYTVECIIKFGIIKCLKLDKKPLSREKLDELRLKTHNIKELLQIYIDNRGVSARALTCSQKLEEWSEEIRYYPLPSPSNDYFTEIIKHFNDTIKTFYEKINNSY